MSRVHPSSHSCLTQPVLLVSNDAQDGLGVVTAVEQFDIAGPIIIESGCIIVDAEARFFIHSARQRAQLLVVPTDTDHCFRPAECEEVEFGEHD